MIKLDEKYERVRRFTIINSREVIEKEFKKLMLKFDPSLKHLGKIRKLRDNVIDGYFRKENYDQYLLEESGRDKGYRLSYIYWDKCQKKQFIEEFKDEFFFRAN